MYFQTFGDMDVKLQIVLWHLLPSSPCGLRPDLEDAIQDA